LNGECGVGKCNSTSKTCYSSYNVSTTICRASIGDCDIAEACTGNSLSCPTDTFSLSSTVCRASVFDCDAEEKCSGSSVSCPTNLNKSDGTACLSGTCSLGKCVATCTPSITCSYYYNLNQCGSSLSDGCSNILNCLSCETGETCSNGNCISIPSCASDYGCTSSGSFCDNPTNMPYTCAPAGEGCFSRTNGTACTGGKSCLGGACVSGCVASGTGFVDSFDNLDCLNSASVKDIIFGSGKLSANGIASGELEAEPTMEGLYHFNNDSRYLEDDVRNINDFSGKSRNAWANSDFFDYSDGKFGNAFDSSHNSSIDSLVFSRRDINQDNMTFAFWIRLSNYTTNVSGSARLFGNYDVLIFSYSSNSLDLRFPGSQHLYVSSLNWSKDSWHHVAVSLKPGNNSIYVDGNYSGSHSYSSGIDYPSVFYIGWWSNPVLSADISIDEFAIWNRNLEGYEIKALAKGQTVNTGEIESNWISSSSGSFNSIKATLNGDKTTKIMFTCDGTNWEELKNGEWEDYNHHKQLPCSKFKYKLKFSGGNKSADSITFEWKTQAESSSFSFAVFGDTHDYNGGTGVVHEEMVNLVSKIDPDLVIHHGDFWGQAIDVNVANWKAALRNIQPLLKRRTTGLEATYFPSVGNHEKNLLDSTSGYDGYYDIFNYSPIRSLAPVDPDFQYIYSYSATSLNDPDDPTYYNNPYYSFKYKNACFISLYLYDADHIAEYKGSASTSNYKPASDPTNLTGASPQYKWLYYTLRDCSQDPNIQWKFVFFHYPVFDSGGHGVAGEDSTVQPLRQHIVPLLEYFKVNIVFNGHDHIYQRTNTLKSYYNELTNLNKGVRDDSGIVYLTSGVSGGTLGGSYVAPSDYTAFAFNDSYHSTIINITGNMLYGETIQRNGTWIDSFTITVSATGTCSNGEQDQDETGVDCGGVCISGTEICSDDIDNDKDCLTDEYDCQTIISRTIYVDKNLASDCTGTYSISGRACSGSDGDAYNTLAEAANVADEGDTVLIRAGTYNQQIKPSHSGFSGGPITFKSYNNEKVLFTGISGYAIDLNLTRYITVDGLNVEAASGGWARILDSDHIILKNNNFTDASTWLGLLLVNSTDNKILNNSLYDGDDNLHLVYSHRNLIEGNRMEKAIHTLWAIKCSNFNVVRNNYFSNDLEKIGEIFDCNDTTPYNIRHWSVNSTKYNLVENNTFAYVPAGGYSGIQYKGQDGIIRKNLFYNMDGPGLGMGVYGEEGEYEQHNRIYSNVFYNNSKGGVNYYYGGGRDYPNEVPEWTDDIYKNNILYKNRDFQIFVPVWCDYYDESNRDNCPRIRGFYFENNSILNNSAGQKIFRYDSTSDRAEIFDYSLAELTSSYPALFKGNVESAPLFVNENTKDFHLQSASQLIDAGAFLTKTKSAGSGTVMQVEDVKYFYDGYDIIGEAGDLIQLEGQTTTSRITDINYETNTLTLSNSLTWTSGQGVSLAYSGSKPDIGAYESSGGLSTLNPILTLWQMILEWIESLFS
jgi:hypothetical protein